MINLVEFWPVFETHDIVEDGVDGGTEVVEETGDVEKVLIDGPVDLGVLEVDITEALGVEGSPADEEGHHHCSWNKIYNKITFIFR